MFDLFRSRDKAVRILLGAILVVVSLSMLTYLIPSYNMGTANMDDLLVAEVGDYKVTIPEVQKLIRATLRGGQIPQNVVARFIPQLVDDVVIDRAMAFEAQRQGFRVTDEQMREYIRQRVPSLFPEGKFVGKDAYAAMLAEQNVSIAEFEEDMRRQALVERLRDVAVHGVIVSPAEIERSFREKNEAVKVQWVKIPSDRYRAEAQPTPMEMEQYFKANAVRFQVPEKRNLALLVADPQKIEAGITVSDADLERLYNLNQAQFRTQERVRARHILLKTVGKTPAEDAKIKTQAADLLKQIQGGADFAALAKKYSEDTVSANNAKSPGEFSDWVMRGQMVPEFEKAIFTLKPGQTSDLVKTEYGYHIIQVLAREDAHLRLFAEVKDEIATQWKKQQVNAVLQAIADNAEAALRKEPQAPEKVAAQFQMQVVPVDGFSAQQPLPELGLSPDFDQAVSGLKPGDVTPAVAFQGNRVALAVVKSITPARPSTFEEVQTQVRESLVQGKMEAALQRHAKELADAAKSSGLAAAAKSMGFEAKTSAEFNRTGNIEGVGSATALIEAFSKPDGAVIGPIPLPDGSVVAQVVQHVQPDMSRLAAERTTLNNQIRESKERIRRETFEEGIREALIKAGKLRVNPKAIQQLISRYSAS